MKKKKTNWRSFVSIYMGYSFLLMAITGIVLYFAPAGRIAFWSNWTFLGFSKKEWQALHTLFSFVWVVVAIYHIIYNWKPLLAYLRKRFNQSTKLTRELGYATLLTVVIFFGTYFKIPPFSTVMDFGDYLTESWETEETEPPIPHAELLTVPEFAKTIKIETKRVVSILRGKGYKIPDTTKTIEEIADLNSVSPNVLYLALNDKNHDTAKYAIGSGTGRKLFSEILKENNISWNEGIEKLKEKNINVSEDKKLKNIAEDNDVSPIEILKALGLVNDSK